MFERIAFRIAESLPEKWKKKLGINLKYASYDEETDLWIGKRIVVSFLIGLIGFLLLYLIAKFYLSPDPTMMWLTSIVFGLFIFVLTFSMYYLHLLFFIEDRAELVESILPDFFLLVANNIRAGLTPFNAFRLSVRPEFGPLADEVKIATSRAVGGRSFTSALKHLSTKIRSSILAESISFFSQSLRSGGHLADLLESTALTIRNTNDLKKELLSNTKMYTIFIGFIIVVVTPLLLSIAIRFIQLITAIQAQTAMFSTGSTSLMFLGTKMIITAAFIHNVSIFLLIANALLSSFFMGTISRGKPIMGVKYFPFILFPSLVMFFIFKIIVASIVPMPL